MKSAIIIIIIIMGWNCRVIIGLQMQKINSTLGLDIKLAKREGKLYDSKAMVVVDSIIHLGFGIWDLGLGSGNGNGNGQGWSPQLYCACEHHVSSNALHTIALCLAKTIFGFTHDL